MREWRNWQTRQTQDLVPKGVGVRVPVLAQLLKIYEDYLEVLVNKIDESHKEIEFKFSYDEVRDEISKEVKKRIQKLQIPGFRKGKAPINLIKKMVGDALEYEASEKVANTFFWDYVDKENIPVIDQPVITHLDFILGEKLHFKVEFESFPEIIVKDYKGIEIEVPELEIDEEKIKYETDLLLK